MTEEFPNLDHVLFKTQEISLETGSGRYLRIVQTGKMLTEALSYGLYNHIGWKVSEAADKLGEKLRVVGPVLGLGEKIEDQPKLILVPDYDSSERSEIAEQKTDLGFKKGLIPENTKQIERLMLKNYLDKRTVIVTLEYRVFNPENIDFEDFARQITPRADYLELNYGDLSLQLVDPVRDYLERISASIKTDDLENAQAELERVLSKGNNRPFNF